MAPYADMGNPINIIGLILCILIPSAADLAFFYLFRRAFPRVYLVVTEVCFLFGWVFGIAPLMYFALAFFVIGSIFFLFANDTETRPFAANNMKGKGFKNSKFKRKKKGESLFDRELVYGKVRDAVLWMSKKKMGAIMTFEREDNLDEIIAGSGSVINAPISTELIQTIFYPGTRLHDGAVVVRNDTIVAAAVFYTPTVRPLTGKYGSRHRAAIGISEICDAVTVVVSEETGRISFAYEGELVPTTPDAFFDTFMNLMTMKKSETEDKE